MPKITELNAITNVANNDLMMVVHDPSGLPSTNKITVNNFITSISSSIIDTTLALVPTANTTTAGKVKVGSGLSTNATGFLNSTLPTGGTAGQVLTKNATNQYVWSSTVGLDKFLFFNSSNNYTATPDDYLILCDPVNVPGDITISLPMDVPDGKRYLIKNMNTGVNNDLKVKVTTTSGENNYIESPVTQQFVAYHDIVNLNDVEEWVFDSTYGYRHLGSTTNSPIFSLDANTYLQVAVKNRSSGNNASADLVLYNDLGEILADNGPYIDIGINSSTYDIPEYSIGGASDSYIYNKGGDLAIGTANTGTTVKIHAGGTTSDDLKLAVNSIAIFANTNFIPTQNTTFSLGSSEYQWKDLWVSNNTIYIGGTPITVAGGLLSVNGSISTGYTGSVGTNGYTGSVGTAGYTGSSGTNGYTGSEGGTGYTGSSGTNGYTGSAGITTKSITTISAVGPTVISNDVTLADPNSAGANVNLTLPSSPTTGKVYTVKNINTGVSVVFVQTDGIDNMENEAGSIGSGIYATISSTGDFITWIYDGSSSTYRIIG